MKITDYIASGILEEYVLGTLSETAVAEVEDMAAKHPEVQEELGRIEESLAIYAKSMAVKPKEALKDIIFKEIGDTTGFKLTPPPLTKNSESEGYNFWLNSIFPPEFEEMHVEVIAELPEETMVIAWIKNGEPDHTHTEYTERFLIVEGGCTADIGGVKGEFGVGDYIEFPKHVRHSYTVTSDIPMKVVACMTF